MNEESARLLIEKLGHIEALLMPIAHQRAASHVNNYHTFLESKEMLEDSDAIFQKVVEVCEEITARQLNIKTAQ